MMKSEQMKTVFNSMRIAAIATTLATVGTGCMTTGSNGQAPQYSTYLDPRAEGFQAVKEAYENQGKKVEATFVPDGQGNMVAVYGVRDKTFIERTNDHLNANEGIYKNVERLTDLGFKTTDLIYDVKSTHALQKISKEEKRQTSAIWNSGVIQHSR